MSYVLSSLDLHFLAGALIAQQLLCTHKHMLRSVVIGVHWFAASTWLYRILL